MNLKKGGREEVPGTKKDLERDPVSLKILHASEKKKKAPSLFLYLPKQVLLTNPMLSTDLL